MIAFFHILNIFYFVCLFFCSYCFASVSYNEDKKYPWYFYPNKVEDSWRRVAQNNNTIVVDVADSTILFKYTLTGKNLYKQISFKEGSLLSHGTSMAALIAGDHGILCKDGYDCNDDSMKITVAGIVPQAKIIDRDSYTKRTLHDVLSDSIEEKINNDAHNKANREVGKETRLITINISGSQNRDNDLVSKIKKWVQEDIDFLIIAAVGNEGAGFTESGYRYVEVYDEGKEIPSDINPSSIVIQKKGGYLWANWGKKGKQSYKVKDRDIQDIITAVSNRPKNKRLEDDNLINKITSKYTLSRGHFPANIYRSTFKNSKRDPIIRVGCSSRYNNKDGSDANICVNSNYGKDLVDILAPGDQIPVLLPSGKAAVVRESTSAATAITTGTAALLSSCAPLSTNGVANEIRQAILEASGKSNQLKEDKVFGNRILSIEGAVKKFGVCERNSIVSENDEL